MLRHLCKNRNNWLNVSMCVCVCVLDQIKFLAHRAVSRFFSRANAWFGSRLERAVSHKSVSGCVCVRQYDKRSHAQMFVLRGLNLCSTKDVFGFCLRVYSISTRSISVHQTNR